jgi:hypothetical protein
MLSTMNPAENRPAMRGLVNMPDCAGAIALEVARMSRVIVQCLPMPAYVIGKDHRLVCWNRALEKFSKLGAEVMIGTQLQWMAFCSEARPSIADLLVDEIPEAMFLLYPGKSRQSRLLKEAYELVDFFPELGVGGKWLHFAASAIRDSQGNIVCAIEVFQDVTRRIEGREALFQYNSLSEVADLKDLESPMAHTPKTEISNAFAEAIVHDFNKSFAAIQAYADHSLDDTNAGNPLHDLLRSSKDRIVGGTDKTRQPLSSALRGRRPLSKNLALKQDWQATGDVGVGNEGTVLCHG